MFDFASKSFVKSKLLAAQTSMSVANMVTCKIVFALSHVLLVTRCNIFFDGRSPKD